MIFVLLLMLTAISGAKVLEPPEVSYTDACQPKDPFFCHETSAGWLFNPFLKTCSYTPRACTILLSEYKSLCEFCLTGYEPTVFHPNSPDNRPATYTTTCSLAMDAGEYCGLKPMKRWYWHPYQEKCIEFDYAGCAGNSNNFPTPTACHVTCSNK